MGISTMVTSMTAAAHTISVDGSVDSATGTPAALERTIWAIPMELAAAASSTGSRLMLMGIGQ